MLRVVCAVIVVDDKFLICQRSNRQSNARKWEFPGGKVNAKESDLEAIKREIKEELDITILPVHKMPSFRSNTGNIELIPFLCYGFSGDIYICEHINYTYATIDELKNFSFTVADTLLIDYLIKKGFLKQDL